MSNENILTEFETGLSSASDNYWVNLEQGDLPVYDGNASLLDILNMTAIARSRETASSYRSNDNIYFSDEGNTINVPLTFYLWPSSLDLAYSLEVHANGSLSERTAVLLPRVGNKVIPMDNIVEFPALLANSSFSWETPCYNRNGAIVPNPSYTIERNQIVLDAEVFGVLRGAFQYSGYKYALTLSFSKVETTVEKEPLAGFRDIVHQQTKYDRITSVVCSVLCTYIDEKGETKQEVLELQIPKSVEMYLSECPGGVSIEWPDDIDGCNTIYYYSVCDGAVLDIQRIGDCS